MKPLDEGASPPAGPPPAGLQPPDGIPTSEVKLGAGYTKGEPAADVYTVHKFELDEAGWPVCKDCGLQLLAALPAQVAGAPWELLKGRPFYTAPGALTFLRPRTRFLAPCYRATGRRN